MTSTGLLRAGGVVLIAAVTVIAASACAARPYAPPTGPGAPFAEAAQVWASLTERCRDTQRFVAEIRVNGWVGSPRQRIAPTLHGAVTRSDDIYLEIPAPGGPVVQMAGVGGEATFLLPRDRRVLKASTLDIVDALIGVRWTAVDLLNVLSGCVADASGSVTGRRYGDRETGDRVGIEIRRGAQAWLRRSGGAWRLEAASIDGITVEYLAREGAFPSQVRVSAWQGARADVAALSLLFTLGQVQSNVTLPPQTFSLDVPEGYVPMTLAELRSLRPLDEGKSPE